MKTVRYNLPGGIAADLYGQCLMGISAADAELSVVILPPCPKGAVVLNGQSMGVKRALTQGNAFPVVGHNDGLGHIAVFPVAELC